MEDSKTLLLRQTKWQFVTLHRKDEAHGVVNVDFANEFDFELASTWRLIDRKGNEHSVSYNKNLEDPRIMHGWSGLRSFYQLTGDHSVFLRYLGDSIFQITVWKTPCMSSQSYGRKCVQLRYNMEKGFHSPNWLNKNQRVSDHGDSVIVQPQNNELGSEAANDEGSCSNVENLANVNDRQWIFKTTLTQYKATGSQLSLPRDFAKFLWKSKFQTLRLCNAAGTVIECDLLIRTSVHKRIKIGKGWKHFCRESGFAKDNVIIFEFKDKNDNLVHLTKCV